MPGSDSQFEFPKTSEHTTIIGRTGSGKTQAGAWLLSHSDFDLMPYVIIDSKGDALLNSVGAAEISIYNEPPTSPGLYITHPLPKEIEEADEFLWKIHKKGRTGLYFDEGFMYAKSNALEAIMMQGRSKEIPVFTLTQRPSWISRYCFSEATHFVVFHLNDRRDQMKVKEFYRDYDEGRQPKYHSQWYNVNHDKNFMLQPVPDADNIRMRIISRLQQMKIDNHRVTFV